MTKETAASRSPTFSITIEAANLQTSELAGLWECVETLARQEPSPREAEEVSLVHGGEVPDAMVAALCAKYPWLTVDRVEPGSSYIAMKLRGAARSRADVMIIVDSDVRFQPGWLANILAPFRERLDVSIVAGETTTPIDGPYGLAVALTFIFPRFSLDRDLTPTPIYWANNVAVRRELLARLPIPDPNALYRGQNILHSMGIASLGQTIWRQPSARVLHVLPSPSEILRRYFHLGRDSVNVRRLARESEGPYRGEMAPDRPGASRLQKFLGRARTSFAEDPRRLVYLPLALPIMAACASAYAIGRISAGPPPAAAEPGTARRA